MHEVSSTSGPTPLPRAQSARARSPDHNLYYLTTLQYASDFYSHEIVVVVLGYIRPELNYVSKGSFSSLPPSAAAHITRLSSGLVPLTSVLIVLSLFRYTSSLQRR